MLAANTWDVNGLVSRYTTSPGRSVFYTWDRQGGCAQRLDSSGNLLGSYAFDGYGNRQSTDNSADPYSGYGGQWGYYRDAETGLSLLGARYYDPGQGRFLNRDPIGYDGGTNLYSYAANNPLAFADPSGYGIWGIGVGGLIAGGAVIIGAPIAVPGLLVGAAAGALVSHFMEGDNWSQSIADGGIGAVGGNQLGAAILPFLPFLPGLAGSGNGGSLLPPGPTNGDKGEDENVTLCRLCCAKESQDTYDAQGFVPSTNRGRSLGPPFTRVFKEPDLHRMEKYPPAELPSSEYSHIIRAQVGSGWESTVDEKDGFGYIVQVPDINQFITRITTGYNKNHHWASLTNRRVTPWRTRFF